MFFRGSLYTLSQKHMLTSVVGMALRDAGVEDKKFKHAIAVAQRKTVVLNHEKQTVFEALDEVNIWHMPLKGSVLKDWYPQFGMRESADVDVLFDSSCCADVRELMVSLGYIVEEYGSGGITCGVKEDGRLKSVAYSKKGECYQQHPTTEVYFDEICIPSYESILESTEKPALSFPMFRMISWDWAVDEAGEPLLIEANLYNGELDFHQLNNGPVFGVDTKEIMDEVFGLR